MRPETPALLERIMVATEKRIARSETHGDVAGLENLLHEAQHLRALPTEGEILIDDATEFLIRCLINVEQNWLRGSDKWLFLARCLHPIVRPDFARALELSIPSTTQDHPHSARASR